MSSYTSRLKLKRPDGSDSFLRTDFVDNLNILEANPGYVPCLSTSRPPWGPAQAGMLISETDTGRIIRWNGSSWAPMNNTGYSFALAANPNFWQVNNTVAVFTVGTVYVPRQCSLTLTMTYRLILAANARQYGTVDPWLDNSSCGVGGGVTWHMPNAGDATGNHTVFPNVVGQRVVGAGNHTIQGWSQIGTYAPDVIVTNIRALVVLSEA